MHNRNFDNKTSTFIQTWTTPGIDKRSLNILNFGVNTGKVLKYI